MYHILAETVICISCIIISYGTLSPNYQEYSRIGEIKNVVHFDNDCTIVSFMDANNKPLIRFIDAKIKDDIYYQLNPTLLQKYQQYINKHATVA